MKNQILKFKRKKQLWDTYTYLLENQENIEICPSGLQEYFSIPKSAKNIFIKLSGKPSKHAYKVHTLHHSVGVGVVDSDGHREWKMMYSSTKSMLKCLVGELEVFYVSVDYS